MCRSTHCSVWAVSRYRYMYMSVLQVHVPPPPPPVRLIGPPSTLSQRLYYRPDPGHPILDGGVPLVAVLMHSLGNILFHSVNL